jgi:hypothetical protein
VTALLHFARVLAGRTYAPLVCSVNADHHRAWLSPAEHALYTAHRRLLCPCGGSLLSVYSPHAVKEPLR